MSVAYHGERFGGYRLIELVGSTASATVHRAVDSEGRTVALKILDARLDEPARQRLARVSATLRDLHHPHIAPVHDTGEADGHLCIATRYVPGGDLAALIARADHLDVDRAVTLLTGVAAALDAAHARGLIHGAVKPANILIATPDGAEHALLTDFGTSATCTPEFLAPEQVDGDEVDPRTDVYALGSVLRFCLDPGRRVPDGLDEVIARATATNREHRYPTASAFLTTARRAIAEPGYRDPEAAAFRSRPAPPRPRWLWSPVAATAYTATVLATATGAVIGVHHGLAGGAQNAASSTALAPRMSTGLLAPRSTATPAPRTAAPRASASPAATPSATPTSDAVATGPAASAAATPTASPVISISSPLSGGNLYYATVRNTGQTDLVAGASSLSSIATAAIVHDGCAGTHLAPGASCLVTVRVQTSGPVGSPTVLSVPISDGKPVTFVLPGTGS